MPTNITLNRNIHLLLLSLPAVGLSGLRVVLPADGMIIAKCFL
jgi:hypothetical protein